MTIKQRKVETKVLAMRLFCHGFIKLILEVVVSKGINTKNIFRTAVSTLQHINKSIPTLAQLPSPIVLANAKAQKPITRA